MWCASPREPTETLWITFPYFAEPGFASMVTSLSDPSPRPFSPRAQTYTKSSCPLMRFPMYGELQVSSAAASKAAQSTRAPSHAAACVLEVAMWPPALVLGGRYAVRGLQLNAARGDAQLRKTIRIAYVP